MDSALNRRLPSLALLAALLLPVAYADGAAEQSPQAATPAIR